MTEGSFRAYKEIMEIIIDKIAIWLPKRTDELTIKPIPKGKMYRNEKGELVQSDRIFYRYAKNYKIGSGKNIRGFSLFVRTFNDNEKEVEKILDEKAKTITKAQVDSLYEEKGLECTNNNYLEEK